MPSCGCDDHMNRRYTATQCVLLLFVAVPLGFGYLWLHYKFYVARPVVPVSKTNTGNGRAGSGMYVLWSVWAARERFTRRRPTLCIAKL